MENKNLYSRSTGNNQTPPVSELIVKYWKLVISKRLLIAINVLVISIIWFAVHQKIVDMLQKYSTTAIIKFDDPELNRDARAVTDFAIEGSTGKIAVLTTSTFLKTVVDSLKLNIRVVTPNINRFNLFKKIHISPDSRYGIYTFTRNNNSIEVFFTNEAEDIDEEPIASFAEPLNHTIDFNYHGLSMKLATEIINEEQYIEIAHLDTRKVIDDLRENLNSSIDRYGIILKITYTSKVPELAMVVTNTISKMYINKLLEMKRYRTSGVLKSFEEQLALSRKELDRSEETLKQFREENPYLNLSNVGQTLVTNLASDQSRLQEINNNIIRLENLIAQGESRDLNKESLVYLELLSFLEPKLVAGSQVFTQEYQGLLTRRNQRLSENYSPTHPIIQSIEERITEIEKNIDERARVYLSQLKNDRRSLQRGVSKNQNQIRQMPSGELRLAELQRDREVKGNIYSNILVRYNEAKISDAAIIPDAYLIEEAQIPIIREGLVMKILLILAGPLIGLILGISIVVVMDLFDTSVRDANVIESKMNLPVLATIPVIVSKSVVPELGESRSELDPKLVTSDYAPHLGGERFRLLRTKLMLDNSRGPMAYVITSFAPSEGKSLVVSNLAITFAQQKQATILVDCDLRRGVLHHSFNREKKPGLSDLLINPQPNTPKALSDIILETHVPNLFLITSGQPIPNPSELLGSNRMQEVYNILKNNFETILLDTPPIEIIPDALVLNNLVHNLLLVVRYGKTNLNKLTSKVKEFDRIHQDFKGIILNASEDTLAKDKYSYSYYQY